MKPAMTLQTAIIDKSENGGTAAGPAHNRIPSRPKASRKAAHTTFNAMVVRIAMAKVRRIHATSPRACASA